MRRFERAYLQEGWVIANHILVSFHVAFISSILALPAGAIERGEVLQFIFVHWETVISAVFTWITFHTAIAVHELGHFLTAVRLNAINEKVGAAATARLRGSLGERVTYLTGMFLRIPYGRAPGVKREGLNYYPDAPYNLAVAAAGPRWSRNLAWSALPPAALLLTIGLLADSLLAITVGRLALGLGLVGLLDFLMADAGKYREFVERERSASDQAAAVQPAAAGSWWERAPAVKARLMAERMQRAVHPVLGPVTAPWQFRNCGMGGVHTAKEYPESNISMQEAMFLVIGTPDYQEAQELTIRLQTRLKEIIEKSEGCRVMGIGLEGGIAPYIERGEFPIPELRLWSMMAQAIRECGCTPGEQVAIALDPAMSELQIAYRAEHNLPDAVGQYLFWRDKSKLVLDRDAVLRLFEDAIRVHDLPILSIEDAFAEDDHAGWKAINAALGDRILIVGDDLVTTNDRTIEEAADAQLANCALIKANQIGTLTETLCAMLVALGKGQELVVSHRSKSPNDDMEGQIALAANALGLKCGGGANTERLVKYQSVSETLDRVARAGDVGGGLAHGVAALVRGVQATEEPTNAGIPTVGTTVEVEIAGTGMHLRFRGATPLGTSAGTGEAIHLVDADIERADWREVSGRHAAVFQDREPGVLQFRKDAGPRVLAAADPQLTDLHARARRYGGKGCLTAAANVRDVVGPRFVGEDLTQWTLRGIDRALLGLERDTAIRRGKLAADASVDDTVRVMQRKQNLGMNGLLSTSLALGRALAHVRGKELWELLREEMLAIVERAASKSGVAVNGTRLGAYAAALREVARVCADRGTPLYALLREVTGIYANQTPAAPTAPRRITPSSEDLSVSETPSGRLPPPRERLSEMETAAVTALDQALVRGLVAPLGSPERVAALQCYGETKARVERPGRYFTIVNNRVFQDGPRFLIPYQVGEALLLHRVADGTVESLPAPRVRPGTICTDAMLTAAARFDGVAVDLEAELYLFDPAAVGPLELHRLQDIAAVLQAVNDDVHTNRAVYRLRYLVAKLSNVSAQAFLGTKNLQPEVHHLTTQLVRFLNGARARRLPLLARLLVRRLPGLIGKPNVIDRIWHDTIQLSEVQVRGSALINELRRSSHHALGWRTLRLAREYLGWCESGDASGLTRLGFGAPTAADDAARESAQTRATLERVAADLEKLLGSSEIVGRLREWQGEYSASLQRCEFGKPIEAEVATLVEQGARARNRWVWFHHLSILAKKAEECEEPAGVRVEFLGHLEDLRTLDPESPDFDPAAAAGAARTAVAAFVEALRATHETELFAELEVAVGHHGRAEHFQTFTAVRRLRETVQAWIKRGGFPEQRYHLCRIDCLLEEMGYLAARHVATVFAERGVDLGECCDVIRICISNLGYDGMYARELLDLGMLLADAGKSDAELLDVLDAIMRTYHKIHQRVTVPFTMMRERLGLAPAELQAVLANLQRMMHDLNTMAHFADIAAHTIRERQARGEAWRDAVPATPPADPLERIVHLSDRETVAALVDAGADGPNLRDLYGGKGSSLIYTAYLGVPTRDGFVLPTTVARTGLHLRETARLEAATEAHLARLEQDVSAWGGPVRTFGTGEQPLLCAVRGGSVFSMPGMLSTVVFVGMTDRVAEILAADDGWCAYDSYRRFLFSFSRCVWGLDLEDYGLIDAMKHEHGVEFKRDLSVDAMRQIVENTKGVLRREGFGEQLEEALDPEAGPRRQLHMAVQALFKSWNGKPAQRYRSIKGICDTWHTAVVVQEMAFGNRLNAVVEPGMDETQVSLTGVIPRTLATEAGVRAFEGECKFSAAGDDLVGGVTASKSMRGIHELATLTPTLEQRLKHVVARLRRFFGTDQEVEFTVDQGVLSVLQARAAEHPAERVADRFREPGEPVTRGVGVCGGGFRGLAAFDEAQRKELATTAAGRDDVDGVLMVLENPASEDIPVIISADGLLTARGGTTSHAAVAINGLEDRKFGAVMSADRLHVDVARYEAVVVDADGTLRCTIRPGDVVSIHGTSGEVFLGSKEIERGEQPS